MDMFTKDCLEESIDALRDVKDYFSLEVKCKCNDEDGICERCTYINELEIAMQRMRNLIK
jgi:hypothetical protein